MARDRLQLRLWRRGERLALPPRIVDGRREQRVTLGISYNPLLTGLLDKRGPTTLWSGRHVVFL